MPPTHWAMTNRIHRIKLMSPETNILIDTAGFMWPPLRCPIVWNGKKLVEQLWLKNDLVPISFCRNFWMRLMPFKNPSLLNYAAKRELFKKQKFRQHAILAKMHYNIEMIHTGLRNLTETISTNTIATF